MAMSMFTDRSVASNDDYPKAFKGDPVECQFSILSIIETQIISCLLKAERVNGTNLTLVPAVENEWFDTVGLSVSIAPQLTDLADLVDQIKQRSRNPRVVVLLGGPIFTVQNLKASDFGAAGICVDAKEAVSLALALQPTDN
jgi:hypothetical protein